jgi:hypothetical protein
MEASAEDGHVLFDSGSGGGGGDGDNDDDDDDDNGGGGDDDDDDDDDDGDGDGDTVDTAVILPGGDRDLQTQRLKAERERSRVVHAGRRFGHMPLLMLPLKLRGGASSVGDDDDDGHGMHWPETARGKQGREGSRKGPKLGRGERTPSPPNRVGICIACVLEGGANFCSQQPSTLLRSDQLWLRTVEDNGPRHDPTHRKVSLPPPTRLRKEPPSQILEIECALSVSLHFQTHCWHKHSK